MDAYGSHVSSDQYVSVVLHQNPGVTLIEVSGELDLRSVHHLEGCVSRALAEGDRKPIHIDMGNVSFVDCAGLEPLIRAAASLQNGRVLKITSASRRVRRLMELMGEVGIPVDESSAHIVSGV